jgi:predicted transcriptional regulator
VAKDCQRFNLVVKVLKRIFMRIKQKTAENVEFCALMKEMKRFKYRPADVARMLNKSQGAVSQYLSGYTKPSETVMALMRRIARETWRGANERDDEIEEMDEKLRRLQFLSPSDFQVIKEQIEGCFIKSLNVKSKIVRKVFQGRLQHVVEPLQPEESIDPKTSRVRSEAKISTES